MQDSIFTKIIKGEIPAHKIYEDEKTLAFLDIYPVAEGHILVIPKAQVEFIWDLEAEDYTALMQSVRKIGKHLRDVSGKKLVCISVVGTEVPHAHVKLIPIDHTDELKREPDLDAEPDHAALAALAEKLKF